MKSAYLLHALSSIVAVFLMGCATDRTEVDSSFVEAERYAAAQDQSSPDDEWQPVDLSLPIKSRQAQEPQYDVQRIDGEQSEYLLKAALYAQETGDNTAMISYMQQAADQGSADAYYELARHYTAGKLVARDLDKANAHLQASAQLGSYEAVRVLAWKQLRGDDGPADLASGAAMMDQAAQGSSRAQREAGMLYGNFYKPYLNDPQKALVYLGAAYEGGDAEAAYFYGKLLEREGRSLDALAPLTLAAESGNEKAVVALQSLGAVVNAEDVRAVTERPANAEAMYAKGNALMLSGKATEEMEVEAYAWFSLASERGYLLAGEELKALDGVRVRMDEFSPGWLEQTKERLLRP